MLETNLRIAEGGTALRVPIRYATVEIAHVTREQIERACNILSYRHQLAARPFPGRENELVVLSDGPLRGLTVEDENATMTIEDVGKGACELSIGDGITETVVPALLERALLAHLPSSTNLWRLDSPRKWLERDPFVREEGIEAYRRYEISSLWVEGVGVGIGVDISTAFLGSNTLGYYFANGLSTGENKRRQEVFGRLTSRQKGQKGTLIYQVGTTASVCYFEKGNIGQTCGRTPEIKVKGRNYRSLYDYYAECHPEAKVKEDEPAVLVSFRGFEQPVWVAARLLRVRVMNDSVPDSLASVDKIAPSIRVPMIERFWATLGETPFGKAPFRLLAGFWRPAPERILTISLPELEFADGQLLAPPPRVGAAAYKQHYRQRGEMLDSAGVFHVPPATNRTIHCAYPSIVSAEAATQLAGDVARAISKWTRVPFSTNLVPYNALTDATARLRSTAPAGTVLFVLDENPAAYYDSAFQLAGWRVKRVTKASLTKHYQYLREGAWDKKRQEMDLRRGWLKWDHYVQMNALDVLTQMDGIPFRIPSIGKFEAELAIDVGFDRRYIAISLLIARAKTMNPSFRIVTEVHAKIDYKLETINPMILADMILQIFGKVLRGKFDPLRSLLVTRDGEYRGEERRGVYQALMRLKGKGFLTPDASTSLAELHKTSQKSIRLWERLPDTTASNPLECQAVMLSPNLAVLATTGEATLHQGTAEPMMISCDGPGDLLPRIVEATAVGAQLNWGSPGVAQRLPIVFKRTDEELDIRFAQEIRRIA
jgi:hypothetical protein